MQSFEEIKIYLANQKTKEISREAFLFNSEKEDLFIQHRTRGTSQCNKARGKHNYWKGKNNTFWGQMI